MTYGYIDNEYNNMDFIKLQQQALVDFSPIYNYIIDEEIIETENYTQLKILVNQMEKGDKLVTCGVSFYGSHRAEFDSFLDTMRDKDIKLIFITRPTDIIIYEINLCLKRINNRML